MHPRDNFIQQSQGDSSVQGTFSLLHVDVKVGCQKAQRMKKGSAATSPTNWDLDWIWDTCVATA